MTAYDKLAEIITGRKASWILLLIFNLYLALAYLDFTGPELTDFTVLIIYFFLIIIMSGRIKINKKKSLPYYLDLIVLITALILIIFPYIFPDDWSSVFAGKRLLYTHPVYLALIMIEAALFRNVIHSYV